MEQADMALSNSAARKGVGVRLPHPAHNRSFVGSCLKFAAWPCVFPQNGPGRKHERLIAFDTWQREIVERHADRFLRGLFHSDGCRLTNWTVKAVAGRPKRYECSRYLFSNQSPDLELCLLYTSPSPRDS